jgi:hypothetical protein
MREFLKSQRVNIEPDLAICKKHAKMDDNLQKYIDRWQAFGFIEGLSGETRGECAYAMEQLAIFLLYNPLHQSDRLFTENNREFETLGFPMIRRIVTTIEPGTFDFLTFIEYCKIFNVIDMVNLAEELNPLTNDDPSRPWKRKFNIDSEAEAVALACEMIETKFKDPSRDNEEIKKEVTDKLKKIIKDKIAKENERASSDNTNE